MSITIKNSLLLDKKNDTLDEDNLSNSKESDEEMSPSKNKCKSSIN